MKSSPDTPESNNQGTKELKGSTVKNFKLILESKLHHKDHSELQYISDGIC